MRTPLLRSLALLLAFLFVATPFQAQAAHDERDTIKKSFNVRPGGTLFLDIDRGTITVEPGAGDAVYIEMERVVRSKDAREAKQMLEHHQYELDQEGNDIHIESRYEQERGAWWDRNDRSEFSLRVRVRVPSRYNIDFTNGAGNVQIADIEGFVEGRTGAGNVVVGRVHGPVVLSSGTGNIEVEAAVGRIEVRSGAGNVTLRHIEGEIRAHTGAGNIIAKMTEQPQGNSSLETGAGNVTVFLEHGVGVVVEANTGVGSAKTDFNLRIEGKWMTKSFRGEVNGGGPRLRLHSGVGNVSLRQM